MGAGTPGIEFFIVDYDGHGLSAADGLGYQDDVRNDAGVLECEHLP